MQGQVSILPRGVPAPEPTKHNELSSAAASGPDFSLNRLYYFSDAARPQLRMQYDDFIADTIHVPGSEETGVRGWARAVPHQYTDV